MVHIFIGTKAQFIKTIPVICELRKRGIKYNLIDSGQHAEITQKLIEFFEIDPPDVYLRSDSGDITKLSQAIIWILRILFQGIFRRQGVWNEIFQAQDGICLIHGDTASTLMSLFLAKRVGIKVAHIEAGLRSFNFLNPFPEELIRLITMRFSDLLFAPSDSAYSNLRRMRLKGKIIHTHGNTVYDSIQLALSRNQNVKLPSHPYVILTSHRFENICSKVRMKFILETARKASRIFNVVFVLHRPTEENLKKHGLLEEFRQVCIMMPMQEYPIFLTLLKGSKFVMTDGGSIQEECYYLEIPCLLLRAKTERDEGINKNVYISKFDEKIVDDFIKQYSGTQLQRKSSQNKEINDHSPSGIIVDTLLNLCKT